MLVEKAPVAGAGGDSKRLEELSSLVYLSPHHEVYLSDPRRVPTEQLKTILRIPVAGG